MDTSTVELEAEGIKKIIRKLKKENPYKSIAEYIWNGFDAKAKQINLNYIKEKRTTIELPKAT